jgi:hypothetical protein
LATFGTRIRTGRREFDELYPLVRSFLERDVLDLSIDGLSIRGYRTPDTPSIWIRDHSDMMRTFRYFERDLTSAVQHFAETQAESGRIFDYFTTFPEKLPSERENWTKYVRVPVEADVDFHVLLPAGAEVREVRCGGRDILSQQATVEQSRYVNFEGAIDCEARFEIVFV